MSSGVLFAALIALNTVAATIPEAATKKQNDAFQRFWGTDFVWKYADLPESGIVPTGRRPYSGYIYPDRMGGTAVALRRYDAAFHGGRPLATAYEQYDTTAYKERSGTGLFRLLSVPRTPDWHGHCNGWAAAAIRHAEPQMSVRQNGVTFTPAHIKALLAEIYIYNEFEHLAGLQHPLNAGVFHAIVANWLGRGSHALGMEAEPGEEKWNYPVYGYSSSSAKRTDQHVEIRLNLAYIKDTDYEHQQAPPKNWRYKEFHYLLTLDHEGNIRGGSFFRDSARIDLLWVPLRPKKSGHPGNRMGNPHVDVDKVLAIWRASVPEEEREKWVVVDPAAEDRISLVADIGSLIPLQGSNAPATVPVDDAVEEPLDTVAPIVEFVEDENMSELAPLEEDSDSETPVTDSVDQDAADGVPTPADPDDAAEQEGAEQDDAEVASGATIDVVEDVTIDLEAEVTVELEEAEEPTPEVSLLP